MSKKLMPLWVRIGVPAVALVAMAWAGMALSGPPELRRTGVDAWNRLYDPQTALNDQNFDSTLTAFRQAAKDYGSIESHRVTSATEHEDNRRLIDVTGLVRRNGIWRRERFTFLTRRRATDLYTSYACEPGAIDDAAIAVESSEKK